MSGNLILAIFGAMGIPTALTGFFFWQLQKKLEKREQEQTKKEKAQEDMQLLNVKATLAALTLSEAVANAVQRIPDAHCNGDMKRALEYATGVKHEVREFLATEATRAVVH